MADGKRDIRFVFCPKSLSKAERKAIKDTKAFEDAKVAAARGDKDALYKLGTFYQHGIGVAVDEAKAVQNYSAASDKGHIRACLDLAACVLMEVGGLKHDAKKAFSLFEKAAATGDRDAQFEVGACLAEGMGVAKDQGRAAKLIQRAANEGHPAAQEWLRQNATQS